MVAVSESTDGAVSAYTVRLELVDEPGELLRALEPIADNGGNLLSIFHERGSLTPGATSRSRSIWRRRPNASRPS